MEYFSRKMVVSWPNKIFRPHSHSFLLRFDTRPTHFQRRIFCTRNSINACVCVRYIFNEARDTRPPMSMEWKKSGKGKNSQNTKEPSTMLFGLKNIDIRMAQLCKFFFFFALLYLSLFQIWNNPWWNKKSKENTFVLFLFEKATCMK